ncbi:MAG TPA: type I 3-dehydroquinate dehydratase [Phycisphaerae bacterium]|nr:type I 3-dehydroquinate dehydratase [Phycisphaerae bacterium]
MTAICVPIFVKDGVDLEEVIGEAEDALRGTEGMIELRCDTARNNQMYEALEITRLPAIVTIRPTWEGGFSEKSEKDRIDFWLEAMDAGADYIDVELVAWEKSKAIREAIEDSAEKTGTRVVVSNHSFGGRPGDLMERVKRLRAVKAASVLKIAWKAESILDGIDALRLTREVREQDGRPVVALAMGEEGQISRILAKKFGAAGGGFTFASATRGKESAPGQPTVAELVGRYRWAKQDAGTPVFGVVGWPVGHSLSPHAHNAGFDAVGARGVYVPLPVRPEYESFRAAVEGMRAVEGMNVRGLSVTIPHKENAFRYVREHGDEIDDISRSIGVINTMLWDKRGKVRGLNSDYAGALDALVTAWSGKREDVRGKRIAVVGAGGAARAIVAALAAHGATVVIYNRTREKAEALAAEFGSKYPQAKVVAGPWEELCKSCSETYINCTPLGMHPNVKTSPIEGDPAWNAETVVFDTVYNPPKTKFLKLAESKGAKTIAGTEMFVGQAAIQFREFTGKDAPLDVFRRVMREALSAGS